MIASCSFASQESEKSTYSCLAGSSPGIRNACKNWPGCLTDSYLLPLGQVYAGMVSKLRLSISLKK